MPKKRTSYYNEFWKMVDKSGECWQWTGARRGGRFGQYGNYRGQVASRVSWQFENGQIPNDMFVLHKCDNPPCVNPDHLFLGTRKDNGEDMARKGRHGRALLNWDLVEEIRALHKQGQIQRKLAVKYGVSPACICNIVKRKKWTARVSGE